ncbi:hypothetical protein LTR70_010720 [Exophiala xenobiotica]|uniref:Uncharacterized protein n=1 Tax=Lithohypha guttulata TaxID=1690604 RepID=A0ABR0JUX2_9EURO|nr:hypothetical protein LTR24_010691 [Lithohypha guttulata]KAK5308950.1 hypothetical protein LTR70_010720 [Exophiala xenobiotica]
MAGTFVKIAVPSSLVTYLVLQYFDPRQRGTHSAAMRQKLQDENKRIGRAHGCQEMHASDVEKWVRDHPEEAAHWKRIKEKAEKHTRSS